jgi:hypothetical protein
LYQNKINRKLMLYNQTKFDLKKLNTQISWPFVSCKFIAAIPMLNEKKHQAKKITF